MDYNVWIDNIEKLKKSNDNFILETMKNENINENINENLYKKLEDLIKEKLKISINNIIKELNNIFLDINYLDLVLVTFKKNIKFILEIVNLKQIPSDNQIKIKENIKKEVEKTYDILIKESYRYDYTGAYELMIKNNKLKMEEI